MGKGKELKDGLVKLVTENSSTLISDPLFIFKF